jgi:hypothetical protein
VHPGGRQRLRGAGPEDLPDVAGVVLGRVEIHVVGHREGHVHARRGHGHQQVLDRDPVGVPGQPGDQVGPDLRPGAVTGGQERVQAALAEQVRPAGQQTGGGRRQVQHLVPDEHADPQLGVPVGGAEHPVGQGGQPERMTGRDAQPVGRGKLCHEMTSATGTVATLARPWAAVQLAARPPERVRWIV